VLEPRAHDCGRNLTLPTRSDRETRSSAWRKNSLRSMSNLRLRAGIALLEHAGQNPSAEGL
jgi:hypothetical protein